MQFDVGEFRTQRWPFTLSFLDAIFAENSLACLDYGADRLSVESLRDCNEFDAAGVSIRDLRCRNNFVVYAL